MKAGAITLATLALAAAGVCAQQEPTLLRHENFIVFSADAGDTVPIEVEQVLKAGWTYDDDLTVQVIGPDSERALVRTVPPGTARTVDFAAEQSGTHAVRLSSGWNTTIARIPDRPWALVAWRDVPVNICGAMAPQHFKVLEGIKTFTISIEASVTGEGAAVRIYGPDGDLALERVGDFDTAEDLTVEVPDGADGRVWSLVVSDPEQEGIGLDDVRLYLGQPLPPFLCEDPEHLATFTAAERYQPDIIDARVEVCEGLRLGAGESGTIRWEMQAPPEGKTCALRVTANDVDYVRELTFTLNGSEPMKVPMTGNSTSRTFTLIIEREMLRAGENTITFTQDPGGGSNVVLVESLEVVIGDRIRGYEGY